MRTFHAHEIRHPNATQLVSSTSDRASAALIVGLFLALAWWLPAAGVLALLAGVEASPLVLASLAYAIAFVGWLTVEGVRAVLEGGGVRYVAASASG